MSNQFVFILGGNILNMNKIRYPKCPYCNCEYKDKMGDYTLSQLALNGSITEATRKCENCGKIYKITVKIMYYGKK